MYNFNLYITAFLIKTLVDIGKITFVFSSHSIVVIIVSSLLLMQRIVHLFIPFWLVFCVDHRTQSYWQSYASKPKFVGFLPISLKIIVTFSSFWSHTRILFGLFFFGFTFEFRHWTHQILTMLVIVFQELLDFFLLCKTKSIFS